MFGGLGGLSGDHSRTVNCTPEDCKFGCIAIVLLYLAGLAYCVVDCFMLDGDCPSEGTERNNYWLVTPVVYSFLIAAFICMVAIGVGLCYVLYRCCCTRLYERINV